MKYIIVLLILFVYSTGLVAQEKLLFSFEKEEVAKLGYIEKDGKMVQKKKQSRSYPHSKEATHGEYSLAQKHIDRWNTLRPGNKAHFYGHWRYGRVFRSLSAYKNMLPDIIPGDWSEYQLLRMDYRTDGPSVCVVF